jgi:hypothetical protein
MKAELLGEEVEILRETIRANDGSNVATGAFARKVDALIGAFYDDIGELSAIQLSDILDLFLIKVLYVNRGSRDAETLAYLGRMMERYLQTGEMALGPSGGHIPYLSDLMEETAHPSGPFQNLFEAYRRYGDNAFHLRRLPGESWEEAPGGRMGGAPRGPPVLRGRRQAVLRPRGEPDLAQRVQQRSTLQRLSSFSTSTWTRWNEMSGRYVMGMDMQLLADRMLDAFNRYRQTWDIAFIETARKYAALFARRWPLSGPPSTPWRVTRLLQAGAGRLSRGNAVAPAASGRTALCPGRAL